MSKKEPRLAPYNHMKTERLSLRVNRNDKTGLLKKADEAGLPLSQYIVLAGLNKKIITPEPPRPKIDADSANELCRIGNNINQIARKFNTDINSQDLKTLSEMMEILHRIDAKL